MWLMTHVLASRVQWFKQYDQLLSGYMRKDTGVGMDLTLVSSAAPRSLSCAPPTHPLQRPVSLCHNQCVQHAAAAPGVGETSAGYCCWVLAPPRCSVSLHALGCP